MEKLEEEVKMGHSLNEPETASQTTSEQAVSPRLTFTEDEKTGETGELLTLLREMRAGEARREKYAKQQLWLVRLCVLLMAGIFITGVAVVKTLAPPVNDLLTQANGVLGSLQTTAGKLAEVDIKGSVDQIDRLVAQSETQIKDTLTEVQTALKKLSDIDIDTLNQAITDLAGVVSPLSKLFR